MNEATKLVLDRILEWSAEDDNILAVVMTGSFAREDGRADELSDLDLELIADDPGPLECDRKWLTNFGKVWVCLESDAVQQYPTRLAFFDGGVKVDFTLANAGRLEDQTTRLDGVYERGYKILVDKRGITGGLPAPSGKPRAIEPPAQEQFQSIVEEFWFEAAQIPKFLAREELWVVKYRDWTMKQLLLKMLEWHAAATSNEPVDVWYIGSRARDWLTPNLWQEVHDTFSRFDAHDSRRGLMASIELFRRVAKETAEEAGLSYPQEVDTSITDYIKSFGRLGQLRSTDGLNDEETTSV